MYINLSPMYQGERVVLSLTDQLPRGHSITCDNFFTTYNLALELLRRKITLVGTVRKNKPFLPQKIVDMRKKDVFYSEFLFTDAVTIVSYVPKKYKFVVALSSLHHSPHVSAENNKKPDIILHYNQTKAGVDALDQLVGNYTCKRQTKRWPVALFSNIMDVSAYNAYVIWTEINPAWNSNKLFKRRLFLEELGNEMIKPHIIRRKKLPYGTSAKSVVHKIQVASMSAAATAPLRCLDNTVASNKRQRCFFCHHTKNSSKYSTICNNCQKFVCKEHSCLLCQNCQ